MEVFARGLLLLWDVFLTLHQRAQIKRLLGEARVIGRSIEQVAVVELLVHEVCALSSLIIEGNLNSN